MHSNSLKTDEQIDTLLNGYSIIQNPKKFMFGIDAILLSAFSLNKIYKNNTIIDLGTGTGIIPLLLESATKASKLVGLEIQDESADMAKRSIEINNLGEKVEIINGDIKKVDELFPKYSFDIVTSNPPYMINEHGKQNPNDAKKIARHEVLCNLEDVINAADYLLKPNGTFFMIHRPFRLVEIFETLKNHKMEPKRLQLVYPNANKEPNIVLIEAKKNANSRLTIEKPLFVYKDQNIYSDEIEEIYNNFKTNYSSETK